MAMFIQKSVSDETISQYKVQGSKLVSALLNFIREEYSSLSVANDSSDSAIVEEDESGDEADIVDDLLKIKSSKRGEGGKSSNGLLDRLKDSCESKGNLARPETNQTVTEVDRALKMFYLHMKMSGLLKEYKEDYFV